ncbi:protein of unknown function [Evansella caseinilytica]|uniref:IrrE N-terminal-like domain-containing protein n=1 Tax=Evansella caseinilytica TaxID=1503961 RepID=A0A1H3V226_9BACI|nr:ImmA/IrrE family metallo-endopeptidase [Evansella caseinilytica]SDZ68760.1 protein of unknown function [Evansella caseinilytica]
MKYYPTELEKWVERLYINMAVHSANDIDEYIICNHLNIHFFKRPLPSFCYETSRFKSITVDIRLSPKKQREVFFHELAHLLRHAGWQLKGMPPAFRQLQEWDAKRFVEYAALPYHMIKSIDFTQHNLIPSMVNTFKVTPELCERRLTRIYEKSEVYCY